MLLSLSSDALDDDAPNESLRHAILHGDMPGVQAALQAGADPNSSAEGTSLLTIAASIDFKDACLLMIKFSADSADSDAEEAGCLGILRRGGAAP